MISFNLPNEVERRIAQLVQETGTTQEKFIQTAIMRYLEDYQDTKDAEAALDEFHQSGEPAIPLVDVMQKYGLAH